MDEATPAAGIRVIYDRWAFALDMNGSGDFTISDITAMFWYALYAPGDFIIFLVSKSEALSAFTEMPYPAYYSHTSLAISMMVWLLLLSGFGASAP